MTDNPQDTAPNSGLNRRKFLTSALGILPASILFKELTGAKAAPSTQIVAPSSQPLTSSCPLDESPLLNLINPSDAVFSVGRIWVTEARGYRVRSTELGSVFPPSTEKFAGNGWGKYNFPMALAALSDGSVAVADTWNHRVVLLNPTGEFGGYIGGWLRRGTPANAIPNPLPGYEAGQFHAPEGMSTLSLGGKDWLGVADCRNHRVQVLVRQSEGNWETAYMVGSLGQEDEKLRLPSGCTLWQAEQNPYLAVVDRGHNRADGGKGRVKIFLLAQKGKLAGKVFEYSHDLNLTGSLDDPRRALALTWEGKTALAITGINGKGNDISGRVGIFDPWNGQLLHLIELTNPAIKNPLGLAVCPCGRHLAVANHGRYPDKDQRGEDGFVLIVRIAS